MRSDGLDELFEVLTLVQTGKVPRLPIVLVGSAFWRRACDLEFLLEQGMLDSRDTELVSVVENAEQAVAAIHTFYDGEPPDTPEPEEDGPGEPPPPPSR